MSDPLQLKNVTKQYNQTAVLKGIDLTIHPQEIFGFVGRNGAGKSTLIHIISGIIHKSTGDFQLFGANDKQMNHVKKRMGVMPDVANLYDHMKGIAFLQYMGKLVGDKRNKAAYYELLEQVGLSHAAQKKIKSYSFGMKKKICIAQALLGDPDFIILDEPTSGLDPESAITIRNLVLQLKTEGKTIFLTSHNLDEIEKISDRVAILSKGKITHIGKPSELKKAEEKNTVISLRSEPLLQIEEIEHFVQKQQMEINYVKQVDKHVTLQLAEESLIPELVSLLSQADYKVYEIKIEEQSLEEIFLNS